MSENVKRRQLLGADTGSASRPDAPETRAQSNMRLLREDREASQLRSLPSALPGAPKFERQSPLSGMTPRTLLTALDSPGSNDPAMLMQNMKGFPSQAVGPIFLSYGPMLGDDDFVVEEWESQICGANGTIYNNQYLWVLRFEGDKVVEMHEYNDSHHAALIFGDLGKWPELKPPTGARRRSRKGGAINLPPDELETVWEVTDKFDLSPRLLADVVPVAGPAPVKVQPGAEGNKALVRGLNKALASGDPAAVNRFHAKGFRHFIAGHPPFGWDHLPLQEIYAPLVRHLASPISVRYGPMIADDTRVCQEMDVFARLDDGTVYNNWSALMHEIRDAKIVQTREYTDTRHIWTVLGRWADWGKTVVPPPSQPRRSNLQGIAMTTQMPTMFLDMERWEPFPPVTG